MQDRLVQRSRTSSRHCGPATSGACGLKDLRSPDPPRVVVVGPTGHRQERRSRSELAGRPQTATSCLCGCDGRVPGPRHRHREAHALPSRPPRAWHLIDIVDPSQEFSVAGVQAEARRVLAGIDAWASAAPRRGHRSLPPSRRGRARDPAVSPTKRPSSRTVPMSPAVSPSIYGASAS